MLVHVRERRPHVDFWNLDRDVDRIFRSFWSDWGLPTSRSDFHVTPDKDGVTIRAEVPGVDPKAIKIAVDGRALTVSGERVSETRSNGTYHLREPENGNFSRTFHLPENLDTEAISADYRHGVLTLRIAKRAETAPRRIEVKSS